MKWIYLMLGADVLWLILLFALMLNFCPPLPGLLGILAVSVLYLVSVRKSQTEQAVAWRRAFRDFLENDQIFPCADPADYPQDYVREIDRVSEELTGTGMIAAGDFCSAANKTGLWKKGFSRIFHSADCTVWAQVGRIRPNFLIRCWWTLLGMGCNFRTLTMFFVHFEQGNVLIASNAKHRVLKAVPGVHLEGVPGQTPRELLQIALNRKREIEAEGVNPARMLDVQSFLKASHNTDIYFTFKNCGFALPSDKTMAKEGFSPSAIEKYRKICTGFYHMPEEKTPAPAAEMPQPPEAELSAEWKQNLKRYRISWLFFGLSVLCSAVDAALAAAGFTGVPLAAFGPAMAVAAATGNIGSQVPFFSVLALAVFAVLLCGLCWLLAKKYRCFILIGLLFFIFDSVLVFLFILDGGHSTGISVLFHVWMIWILFSGVCAWFRLKRLEARLPGNTPGKDGRLLEGCLIGGIGLAVLVVLLIAVIIGISAGNTSLPESLGMPLTVEKHAELAPADPDGGER